MLLRKHYESDQNSNEGISFADTPLPFNTRISHMHITIGIVRSFFYCTDTFS